VERWRKTFLANGLELDHERASHLYLESFADRVALVDGAEQVCGALSAIGKVGVITTAWKRCRNAASQPPD
jgi:2-haloacid dehalogenase